MFSADTVGVSSESVECDKLIASIKQNIRDGNDYDTEWEALMRIKKVLAAKIIPFFPEGLASPTAIEPVFPTAMFQNTTEKMPENYLQEKIERFLQTDFPLLTASKIRDQSKQLNQQSELMATMQSQLEQVQSDLKRLMGKQDVIRTATAPGSGMFRQ